MSTLHLNLGENLHIAGANQCCCSRNWPFHCMQCPSTPHQCATGLFHQICNMQAATWNNSLLYLFITNQKKHHTCDPCMSNARGLSDSRIAHCTVFCNLWLIIVCETVVWHHLLPACKQCSQTAFVKLELAHLNVL